MAIDLGDIHPLAIETRDSAGTLANAGAVVLTIGLPDGTSATPAVTNDSAGKYHVDYQTVQAGRHTVRWNATGVNASAYADTFDVRPSTPIYIVSLARTKQKLKILASSTDHDEEIRDYIESATHVVERHRQETVVRRTLTDYHNVWGACRLVLDHSPVISLTSVQTVDGVTTWNVANLHVDDDAGIVTVKAGPALTGHLKVVYVAGHVVIPANYITAALIIIEHLWQTERAQSVAGPYPGAYEDTSDGMKFARGAGFAIPNRALELLGKPAPMVG